MHERIYKHVHTCARARLHKHTYLNTLSGRYIQIQILLHYELKILYVGIKAVKY